jgi:hypothetical protein
MSSIGEIELRSGRRIQLKALQQYRTYEGWLEGFPTTETNNQQIERLAAEYQGKPYLRKPYLIKPAEKPIELPENVPSEYGTPSELPAVTCIGRFGSTELSGRRRQSHDYSELVIIWLQDEFAFPIDPAVVSQLLAIDWDAYAAEMCY